MTDRKTWVISIPPVKCPDDMTGIPNYYIQIWEKYVGKVKPEGGDREDWIETCSRLYRFCFGEKAASSSVSRMNRLRLSLVVYVAFDYAFAIPSHGFAIVSGGP